MVGNWERSVPQKGTYLARIGNILDLCPAYVFGMYAWIQHTLGHSFFEPYYQVNILSDKAMRLTFYVWSFWPQRCKQLSLVVTVPFKFAISAKR